jgi:hypothetical protein
MTRVIISSRNSVCGRIRLNLCQTARIILVYSIGIQVGMIEDIEQLLWVTGEFKLFLGRA